jgi:hypothetical protein
MNLASHLMLTCIFCDDVHAPLRQDIGQSWPTYVADALGAEASVIAWSGIGCLWNAPHTDGGPMLEKYDQLVGSDREAGLIGTAAEHGSANGGQASDRRACTVGMVVFYLGGNDWWTLQKHPSKELDFVAGMSRMLRQTRELRPLPTPIVVLVPGSECTVSCTPKPAEQVKFSETMRRVHAAAVEAAGGEAHGITVAEVTPEPRIELGLESDWGGMLHWSAQAQRKWAAGVIPHVRSVLGALGQDELQLRA